MIDILLMDFKQNQNRRNIRRWWEVLEGVAIATGRWTRKQRGRCTRVEQICTLAKPASILHRSGGFGSSGLSSGHGSTHCLDSHFGWSFFLPPFKPYCAFPTRFFLFCFLIASSLRLPRETKDEYSIMSERQNFR